MTKRENQSPRPRRERKLFEQKTRSSYPAGDGFEARNAHFKGFVRIGKDVTFHKIENPQYEEIQLFLGNDEAGIITIQKSWSSRNRSLGK